MANNNNNPFPSSYEEFIYKSRYARWLDDEKRREDWPETVARLVDYYSDQVDVLGCDLRQHSIGLELYEAIYNLEVMPSMRAMMTAGPALDRCHVPAYNCACWELWQVLVRHR